MIRSRADINPTPWGTTRRWGGRAGGAVLVSAIAHAALAVTAGAIIGARHRGRAPDTDTVEISVDPSVSAALLAPGADAPPTAARAVAKAARREQVVARQTALAARAPETTAPAPSPAVIVPAADEAPARFAMSAATLASVPASAPPASAAAPPNDVVLAEAAVSVPARLLSGPPPAYPAQARAAEIEGDLPLEIVVGADGRIAGARALTSAGYGLEAAALAAVRGYRFSPAQRDGHPVAVRMRWTVQFRLR